MPPYLVFIHYFTSVSKRFHANPPKKSANPRQLHVFQSFNALHCYHFRDCNLDTSWRASIKKMDKCQKAEVVFMLYYNETNNFSAITNKFHA